MTLTQAEDAQFWQVLKDSPLVQKWPDFRTFLLPRLELKTYAPGDFVFHRGDPPTYLFIVATGRVVMRLAEGGDTWFEQEFLPGQFFGQQALFDEMYRAAARASLRGEQTTLLLMRAADLREAMERAPTLREDLLHEARAGRLRRIPLFRDLTDDQVRWLAHLVDEVNLARGEALALPERPGIWIVDQGQIALKGPINPYPVEWEAWRITVGNFFVSQGDPGLASQPGKMMRFGLNCAADSAVAHVPTHLFYLPAEHADRLITMFPDVGSLVQQPVNIVATLNEAELFKDLSPRQKHHLAQFTAWEFVPESQNITTQGSAGHSYVMVREGGALITAFDNFGRERPRSRVQPKTAFGKTSLLQGKTRDVTVRAVRGESVRGQPGLAGADILTLDRRDFGYALADKPDIWSDAKLAQKLEQIKELKPAFGWMQEGEVVKWKDRPHLFWLILPLSIVVLLLFALTGLASVLPGGLNGAGGIALLLIAAFVLLPLAIGLVINYYDDYYVVTNRRVTRRDRQLLLFESRAEAPVEMIQDVTIDTNFWGRIFDYGDVSVRTASKAEPIKLNNTPDPYRVQKELEVAKTEAQAQERGRQKEELRRGLIKDLRLALPIPQRQRALGDVQPPTVSIVPPWFKRLFTRPPRQERLPTPPNTKAWLAQHSSSLPEGWRRVLFGITPPVTPAKELPGMVIWRKHWLNALGRIGAPFLMTFALLVIAVLLLAGLIDFAWLDAIPLLAGWSVLMAFAAFWFWWEFTDYRNDVYIATDDRVIDIEMKPLGLNAKRREGGLEKVQNVVFQQNGIWATIFDYGDVVISTAASDEGFTFNMVPNPKYVQATVFQKLNRFRLRDEQRRASSRQQELIEALSVYHQLRGGGTQADGFTEQR